MLFSRFRLSLCYFARATHAANAAGRLPAGFPKQKSRRSSNTPFIRTPSAAFLRRYCFLCLFPFLA
jgi:hypothetical protein